MSWLVVNLETFESFQPVFYGGEIGKHLRRFFLFGPLTSRFSHPNQNYPEQKNMISQKPLISQTCINLYHWWGLFWCLELLLTFHNSSTFTLINIPWSWNQLAIISWYEIHISWYEINLTWTYQYQVGRAVILTFRPFWGLDSWRAQGRERRTWWCGDGSVWRDYFTRLVYAYQKTPMYFGLFFERHQKCVCFLNHNLVHVFSIFVP